MSISYHKIPASASAFDPFCEARVVLAGGVATVTASSKAGKAPATVRMAGGLFLRRDTGEILEPAAGSDGGGDRAHTLAASMEQLRHLIAAGVRPGSAWLTLTYRACVRETDAVYEDWKSFIRSVRRASGRRLEYITAIEPQARGSWHIHGLLIPGADDPSPVYIPQADLLRIWRGIAARRMPEGDDRTAGGVHIHRIADAGDHLGAYLSAYLSDAGGKKGARLAFYPRGCRFYRVSRGVHRPVVLEGLTLAEARQIAAEHTGAAAPGYSRGYAVVDPVGRCVCVGVREQSVRGRR